MKNTYDVTGFFYNIGDLSFRKILEIKSKNAKINKPDIIVVMMNPGSSKPLDENNFDILCETKPDNTQFQILKLMINCNFKFARVLNLSDLREPKSHRFIKMIAVLDEGNLSHSIFSKTREEELKQLVNIKATVVFAWGVDRKLNTLAGTAVRFFKNNFPDIKITGYKKTDTEYQYYHPLPRNPYDQERWVQRVTDSIRLLQNTI